MDLRLRPGPRRGLVFAGVTTFDTASLKVWSALEMAVVGLVGGDSRGDVVDDFAGVPRVERGVGEAGSGKERGWCRVETMTVDLLQ